jgi:thiamine biosynthesis lipoprotein
MAVTVRIVLYAPDEAAATTAARAAFERIHELNGVLSDYDPESELRDLEVAAAGGEPVPVGDDLFRVLARSQELARRSEGVFDVTVGPVVRVWRRARQRGGLPMARRLDPARELVGYDLLRLDPDAKTVTFAKPGMRLDFGGIAKGYAVDEALAVLREHGITRALVDAGGDMALGDPPPDAPGWRIAVAPLEADGPPSRILVLKNAAVATSGDLWQFVKIRGRRYSHIVDPRTGQALTERSSVTVVAPDGMTADGLASALSVLGSEKGLTLADAMPGVAALIVRAAGNGVETHESRRWKELPTSK